MIKPRSYASSPWASRAAHVVDTGRVLYEEEFTLAKGEEIVLTAWERPNETHLGCR